MTTVLPTDTYIETYLDHKIYRRDPPYAPSTVYLAAHVSGFYSKKSAVRKRICIHVGGTWDGSKCLFEEPDVDIPTKISIFTPSNVSSGESFEVFGVLQRADTNATLNGETIQLWIDGVHVASTVTTIIGTPMGPQDGAYLFTRSISSDGEHMLEVKFLGSTSSGLMLGASNAVLNLGNRLRDLIQSIF